MADRVFFSHEASLRHDTGGHPECPERIAVIERTLERSGWHGFERRDAPAAERALLERCHDAGYVAALERFCAAGGGHLDVDTVASEGSWDAALRAAGGAVAVVDALLGGEAAYAFAAGRPPGHHATHARAMGFCLFNNVALAAIHALTVHALERVLILDWDVHHGNGTNDLFHETDAVLYASIHQSPLYPGTGAAEDQGAGAGEGFTLNLPVAAGSGDDVFIELVVERVRPRALGYRPQLILISAGYDAHADDPLAACTVTTGGYRELTAAVRELAGELGVGLGFVLEGGYSLTALPASVAATLAQLDDAQPPSSVASA
jgi:acetoin utilization deacetylase AcuC-like enzyme